MSVQSQHYLVAVLPNRAEAEAAFASLQDKDLPVEQVDLLGQGYKSADQFGLINPNRQAKRRSRRLAYFAVPFGVLAGYSFNWLTGIDILPWVGAIGDHILGGFLGMASGALGAFVVGGLVGLTVGSGDALAYRNRINAGKYLIVAKGNSDVLRQATRTLRQFELENIQGYAAHA